MFQSRAVALSGGRLSSSSVKVVVFGMQKTYMFLGLLLSAGLEVLA